MLLKFIFVIMATAFLLPSGEAFPKLKKLNKSPVCFGAKGNQYGHFTTRFNRDISVVVFMLVHRSGKVSCRKSNPNRYSNWGCDANSDLLLVIITDQQNSILAPAASTMNKSGSYRLAGYTASSSSLVFCTPPYVVSAKSELRLWYGEDLVDFTESDNDGTTCADVYGLLA